MIIAARLSSRPRFRFIVFMSSFSQNGAYDTKFSAALSIVIDTEHKKRNGASCRGGSGRSRTSFLLVLDTSLTVFPAASLPRIALQAGAQVFIVNAQKTTLDDYAVGAFRDLKSFADAILAI